MKVLLVGGTANILGGVDRFNDRAMSHLLATDATKVARIRTNAAFLRLGTFRLYLSTYVQVLKQRRAGWDCVWLQYVSFPELPILLWCRLLGYPVVVTPHLGANWRSIQNPFLCWITRRVLQCSSMLALLSDSQRLELPLPHNVPIKLIRTFLPTAIRAQISNRPDISNDRTIRLIHVARLSAEKGTFTFIEVCRLIRDRGAAVKATLIGQASQETIQKIEEFITSNDMSAVLRYAGKLDEKDVLAALCNADILLHPSLVDSYPLIVLEAIGSGVYPICLDLPGARGICSEYCGTIFEREIGPSELADIICAGQNEMKRVASTTSARLAADHDGQACVELLLSVLRSATAKAGRRTNTAAIFRSQ